MIYRYGTSSNFDLYKDDYITLYVTHMKTTAMFEDPGRQYIVSSPSNGIASEEDGYIAENPYDPLYGDG